VIVDTHNATDGQEGDCSIHGRLVVQIGRVMLWLKRMD
jgi:hypothetical protein